MKAFAKKFLRRIGLEVRRALPLPSPIPVLSPLQLLDELRRQMADLADSETQGFVRFAAANWQRSHSQLFQDLFVLFKCGERPGCFVEIGAGDGHYLSNSLLLEQNGWTGIIAEPAHSARVNLGKRRCSIDTRCVWSETDKVLTFQETRRTEYSTVASFAKRDHHDRAEAISYDVRTVSLDDLLATHGATKIDYLSVDTEGSELEILSAFSFKAKPTIITVEHNYVLPKRESLHALLIHHGYRQVCKEISLWDDWYLYE
jgi:FkbM family methyltransferase